jgi:hypothetical protein
LPAKSRSSASTGVPVADRQDGEQVADAGLSATSKTTSRPVSVTALLTFFTMALGSSSTQTVPLPPMLLLIFRDGSCRSLIRSPACPA